MSKDGRELAKYFYSKTGLKCATQKMFLSAASSADALLRAGWTNEDIMKTIDYLIIHPPSKGMYSLAFLQYVIDETMAKMKAEEARKAMQEMPIAPTTVSADDDNRRKYEEQQRNKTKTSKLFNI